MTVQLADAFVERLRTLPESGMGYQVVDVELRSGKRISGLTVFNGEELQVPEPPEFGAGDIVAVELHERRRVGPGLVALALAAVLAGPLAAEADAAPICRTLTVTNGGTTPVWIGGSGGSVVPACQLPSGTVCLADPSRTANGACACAVGSAMNGGLVCPSGSTATANGQFCTCTASDKNACGGAGAATACSSAASPTRCFWTLPEPTTHGKSANPWELLGAESATFCLPLQASWPGASGPIVSPVWWSGGIFGRTGCQADGTRCATGDCTTVPKKLPNQNCPPGVGGSNPFTQAEFTFQTTAVDFYDVTLINGASTVVVMAPTGTTPPAGSDEDPDYWCTAPGSKTATRGLQACDWTFEPIIPDGKGGGTDQTTLLLDSWLPCDATKNPSGCPTGLQCSGEIGACFKSCTTQRDCPGSLACVGGNCQCRSAADCASLGLPKDQQQCGTQFVPGVGKFLQSCGAFAGWWTADDFCGLGASHGPLDCTASITDGNGSSQTTLQNLFLCIGANAASCYNTTAGNQTCCGCATDRANPLAASWPPPAAGNQCFGNNTTWAGRAQPWLLYLKEACPTAYTYPYDDATSTFKCSSGGAQNTQGYAISIQALAPP